MLGKERVEEKGEGEGEGQGWRGFTPRGLSGHQRGSEGELRAEWKRDVIRHCSDVHQDGIK